MWGAPGNRCSYHDYVSPDMIFNIIFYSLPPIVFSYLLCNVIDNRIPSLQNTHLSKLGIYELSWLLYWLGWSASDTASQGHPPGILIFLGLLIIGLFFLSFYGILYGIHLHISKLFSKVRDWILFAINLVLMLGIIVYSLYMIS